MWTRIQEWQQLQLEDSILWDSRNYLFMYFDAWIITNLKLWELISLREFIEHRVLVNMGRAQSLYLSTDEVKKSLTKNDDKRFLYPPIRRLRIGIAFFTFRFIGRNIGAFRLIFLVKFELSEKFQDVVRASKMSSSWYDHWQKGTVLCHKSQFLERVNRRIFEIGNWKCFTNDNVILLYVCSRLRRLRDDFVVACLFLKCSII